MLTIHAVLEFKGCSSSDSLSHRVNFTQSLIWLSNYSSLINMNKLGIESRIISVLQ